VTLRQPLGLACSLTCTGTIQGSAAASAGAIVAAMTGPYGDAPTGAPALPLPSELIGDSDRDCVIEELRDHLCVGRLTTDESRRALAQYTEPERAQILLPFGAIYPLPQPSGSRNLREPTDPARDVSPGPRLRDSAFDEPAVHPLFGLGYLSDGTSTQRITCVPVPKSEASASDHAAPETAVKSSELRRRRCATLLSLVRYW
jgi:hypothetical protein